nr:hypothetical protein RMQUEJLB_RMQUEJLB_CDS_0003 [Microvirus sp.]
MDKKKIVALVAAISAFVVSVVPLIAELINKIIETKGVLF